MPNLFTDIATQEPLIPTEEFFERFDEEWRKVTRRFFKFEALQFYDEGDESGFAEFQRGEYRAFAEKVRASHREEKPFYDSAISRGTSFQRLRTVRYPLTDYLKFEYYTYFVSQEMGETIRFLEEAEMEKAAGFLIPDLVLFDDTALFQYHYEGDKLTGGYYVRDRDIVQAAGQLMERLFAHGKPFTQIMPADPAIVLHLKGE
jgi:hypothetical protein